LSSNLSVENLDEFLTQAEAARIRGVSRQAINLLIKKGKVQGYSIGGVVFVEKSEILKYKAKKAGRPKKT